MSESTSNIIESKGLKDDAIIKIEISAAMYQRLQSLLMLGIPFTDIEVTRKVLSTIRNSKEDPDAITYHTRTLLNLISSIEEAAEKQVMLEVKKFDRTTGKPI